MQDPLVTSPVPGPQIRHAHTPSSTSGRASRATPPVVPETREIHERNRIVDPTSPEAVAAMQYCENLLKVMFLPQSVRPNAYRCMEPKKHLLSHDFERAPVQILFSALPKAEAWLVTDLKPPAIVLGRSLWTERTVQSNGLKKFPPMVQTVQDLAIVLGKAMLDLKHQQQTGKKYPDATSEAVSWQCLTKIFFHLGLDPRRIDTYLSARNTEKRTAETTAALETIKLTNAASELGQFGSLEALDELKGDPTLVELPAGLVNFALKGNHHSALKMYLEGYPNYESQSLVVKIGILSQFLSSNDLHIQDRIDAITVELKALQKDAPKKTEPELKYSIGMLADTLLDYACKNRSVNCISAYKALGALDRNGKVVQGTPVTREGKPLGRLFPIAVAAKKFVDSFNVDDDEVLDVSVVEATGNGFADLALAEPAYRSSQGRSLMKSLTWPCVDFPDIEDIEDSNCEITWGNLRSALTEIPTPGALVSALLLGYGKDPIILEHLSDNLEVVPKVFDFWVDVNRKMSDGIVELCEIHGGPSDGRHSISHLVLDGETITKLEIAEFREGTNLSIADRILRDVIGKFVAHELKESDEQVDLKPALVAFRTANYFEASQNTVDFAFEHPELLGEVHQTFSSNTLEERLVARIREELNKDAPTSKPTVRKLLGLDMEGSKYRKVDLRQLTGGPTSEKPCNELLKFLLENPKNILNPQEQVRCVAQTLISVEPDERENSLPRDTVQLCRNLLQRHGLYPESVTSANVLESIRTSALQDQTKILLCAVASDDIRSLHREKTATSKELWSCMYAMGAVLAGETTSEFGGFTKVITPEIEAEIKRSTPDEATRVLLFALESGLLEKADRQEAVRAFTAKAREGWSDDPKMWEHCIFRICRAGRVPFPQLRSELFELWAKTVVAQHGVDYGDPEYFRKIVTEVVTPAVDAFSRFELSEAMDKLTWELETQWPLTDTIEREVIAGTDDSAMLEMLIGEGSKQLLSFLRKNPKARAAMQTFLMSDNTISDQLEILKEVSETLPEMKMAVEASVKCSVLEYQANARTRRLLEPGVQLMQVLHEAFSAGSLPTKTAIIKQLLAGDNGAIDDKTVDATIADCFPNSMPDFEAARDLLKRHLNVYDVYSREAILSALIASRQGQPDEGFSAGKAVALFCEAMGGAYIKCAQKAEADRSLPLHFREDLAKHLARLKFDGARPTRFELWALINREPVMLKGVARVGKVKGSASTAVAARFENKNGSADIGALIRPFAAERLAFGFAKIGLTADSYGKDSLAGRTISRVSGASKDRAGLECNCAAAPKQYGIGHRLFAGCRVIVDGRAVEYDSAQVKETGSTYYKMTEMEGDILAEVLRDPLRIQDAQDFAMADIAMLVVHASHGIFESDRHAGQANANGRRLGQYDMKAMLLDPKTHMYREWTQDDYKQVAEILAEVLADPKNITTQKFIDAEEKIVASGREVSPLVTELQTALMAVSDRFKVLNDDQIKSAVMAGLKKGMHPHLASAVTETVMDKAPIPGFLKGAFKKSLKKAIETGNFDGTLMKQLTKLGFGTPTVDINIELPPGWKENLYREALGRDTAVAA